MLAQAPVKGIVDMKKGMREALCYLRVLLLAACLGGGYLGYLQLSGNFHTVIAGELYRSGQLTAEEIATYDNRYHIGTIVNLRGENSGSDWYDAEIAASRKAGIDHIDFRMSARKMLSTGRAAQLVAILKEVKKPILIHCKGGADRTGLATALYMAAVAKAGEEPAEDAISIVYGHIGIPLLSQTYAMERSWEKLEPWLGYGAS